MKLKLAGLLLLYLLTSNPAYLQDVKQVVQTSVGAPTGACAIGKLDVDTTNQAFYFCGGDGAWHASGGGGTVTSVTASAPVASSGGNTPNITCTTCATTTNGGALSGTAPVSISAGGAISVASIPNSSLANSSVTVNGTSIALGASGTPPGAAGVNAQTANYTLVAGDQGKIVTMNGRYLTATLPASPPSATWWASIENLANTHLLISNNGLQINGGVHGIGVPQNRIITITTDGTNYFATSACDGRVVCSFDYGALFDGQKVTDAVISGVLAGQTTLTSATANFNANDVGKFVWCTNTTPVLKLGNTSTFLPATITAFTSSTVVTTSNPGSTASAGSGLSCAWGTDDTVALQAATTASQAASSTSQSEGGPYLNPQARVISLPEGGSIVGGKVFNFLQVTGNELNPSIIGAGPFATTLFVRPDATTAGLGGSNGVIVNVRGLGSTYQDFGVDGVGWVFNWASVNLLAFNCTSCMVRRVAVTQWGNQTGIYAMYFAGGPIYVDNVRVQDMSGSGATDGAIAAQFNAVTNTDVFSSLFSNFNQNVVVNGVSGGSSGQRLGFFGGLIDECGSTTASCTAIVGSKDVDFVGTVLLGSAGINAPCVSIDGTSEVRLVHANIGAFGAPTNAWPISIAPGGKVWASESEFRALGNGASVVNAGTFQDVGGNTYTFNAGSGGTDFLGNGPSASLTHTWNTCPETLASFATATLCNQFIDQKLAITRIKASSNVTTTCSVAPVVTITDGTNSQTLSIASGAATWDSGVIVNKPITASAVAAGGAGYAVNDTGYVNLGTGTPGPGIYTVTGVSSGAVTTFTIASSQGYSVNASTTTTKLTGAGNGAFTINVSAVGAANTFASGNTVTVSTTGGTCTTPPTNFAVTYNMQTWGAQ